MRRLQLKTLEKDGCEAVQIGFGEKARRLARHSERSHVANIEASVRRRRSPQARAKKAGGEARRFVREFRVPVEGFEVGQNLGVKCLMASAVGVTARSKGRGTAGVMKRHNFSGQRKTHGVKKCHRHLGGTGCSATPSRVIKGKKMPGRYGNVRCTIRNQKVVVVDKENNLLVIRGAVPGPTGAFVSIRPTNKLPAPKNNKWRLA